MGTRSDSVGHLTTAIKNGFDYAVVGAPLIIADGLRGGSETAITVNLNRYKKVFVGSEIVRADAIVSAADISREILLQNLNIETAVWHTVLGNLPKSRKIVFR